LYPGNSWSYSKKFLEEEFIGKKEEFRNKLRSLRQSRQEDGKKKNGRIL